ncbi:ABC transporter ATP-binding protein [Fodinibius sediminis]|uniref:Heme exporter protein A n=1 Tax=Fodinibius sediminis TaxID=1214077 RepID=A0A521DX39_9BACT|nr:ABC transporter ATP-binding protein [Fodinibius sediminis]SMO76246.1 heme exporter protein A [Fodinibius sediminis]
MITLQVKRLKKSFGPKNIFRDLTLEHSGSALGIAGSNGSGKSTLLKCLSGLLPPTGGTIYWIKGEEQLPPGKVRKRMGYAAPYINLYDELSSIENLQFLAKVRRQPAADQQIKEWIQRVGLESAALQPYGKLSTGQQQRLRLASALFHQPDILLLDEPGSNLDEAGQRLVTDIAADFQANDKLLVLASNSRQELALCEKVYSVEKQTFL